MDDYDEFGNYIGSGALAEDFSGGFNQDEDDDAPEWLKQQQQQNEGVDIGEAPGDAIEREHDMLIEERLGMSGSSSSTAIVMHEDKAYYPSASAVYPGAETMVQDEDTQPLSKPIVAPVVKKTFSLGDAEPPATNYSPEFLCSLLSQPRSIRNIVVVGHLHHGKTSLLDLLIESTHEKPWSPSTSVRYTDVRNDEQERAISIKCTPVSIVSESSSGKSYALNILDTPGHVNFSDEVTASMRVADGVVLCVDAVEGCLMNTDRLVRHALSEHLPILLVITKVDRLILELKLPPADAYHKLAHIISEVNALIESHSTQSFSLSPLSPLFGTVIFSSALHGWSFSIDSFARMYADRFLGGKIDPKELSRRLWGDVFYDTEQRKFKNRGSKRSFVYFVLEPLYKIYSQVLGEEVDVLAQTLSRIGVKLTKSELKLDPKPLLKLVFRQFLGSINGFVDMVVAHVPSADEGAAKKVEMHYTGDLDSAVANSMRACDPNGELVINIVKLFSSTDASQFFAFGRIMSGTVHEREQVRVLGESYSSEDSEDLAVATVSTVSIGQARYRIEVQKATAGSWVYLGGIDGVISKTATILSSSNNSNKSMSETANFRPLTFNTIACVNLSIEPLNPSELPRVLAGIRSVQKSYPLSRTRVEESGEHVLIGTGELQLDCMMRDLREMYSGVEVKVADPIVSFSETCIDQSSMPCFSETPNKKNKLTMLAEPLDKGLASDIEGNFIDLKWGQSRVSSFFQNNYEWDLLAARSPWAFGPTERSPNILLDDTLSSEVDRKVLAMTKESVIQGFKWACREGPLCDEPIRNVKFKLIDARIANEAILRGGGQIIPTARRVAYSAMLLATPRLMEPVYAIEVLCTSDATQAVETVLSRRRGRVTGAIPRPGTPFHVVKGFVPVVDSFGFETDLRVFSQGLAFGMSSFDHWAVVPGDPLDKSIVLRPLEPSPPLGLAREFMIKSRRRKGLSEDVSITRFFDDGMALYYNASNARRTNADINQISS
jgi:U5 small nuclear ribonucleoprotein component